MLGGEAHIYRKNYSTPTKNNQTREISLSIGKYICLNLKLKFPNKKTTFSNLTFEMWDPQNITRARQQPP